MKKVLIILLVLSLFCSTSVFATDNNEKKERTNAESGVLFQQSRLVNIQNQILRNQTYIDELNNKSNYLSNEIKKLDDYIIELQDSLNALNKEIQIEDSQLDAINRNKKKRIESFNVIKNDYEKIKENFNLKETDTLEDIETKTTALVSLSQSYIKVLETQNNILTELNANERLSELATSSKKQERENVARKQAVLQEQQQKKQTLIQQYYADASNTSAQIDELESASVEVAGVIKQLQSAIKYQGTGNLLKGKGVLSYPCSKGYLTSDYGSRVHPISGVVKVHAGIDIGGNPVGTPVLAAADGIVINAGWISGYGYTIILDHGNQISTLYGHNSKLVVKVGDVVHRGQKVAEVGSTGNSTGPHIHFEVRVNGEHTDPKEWL